MTKKDSLDALMDSRTPEGFRSLMSAVREDPDLDVSPLLPQELKEEIASLDIDVHGFLIGDDSRVGSATQRTPDGVRPGGSWYRLALAVAASVTLAAAASLVVWQSRVLHSTRSQLAQVESAQVRVENEIEKLRQGAEQQRNTRVSSAGERILSDVTRGVDILDVIPNIPTLVLLDESVRGPSLRRYPPEGASRVNVMFSAPDDRDVYRLEIVWSDTNDVLWMGELFPDEDEALSVQLPRELLADGGYVLILYPQDGVEPLRHYELSFTSAAVEKR